MSSPVTSPVDLSRFPSLDLGPVRPDYLWELESADGQKASVPHAPRIITADMPTLRAAALEGLGIVQLPTLLIWPDVQAGRLVHVLPEWRPPARIIHAVFPSRRGQHGRASWRGRVWQYVCRSVVAVSFKQQNTETQMMVKE